MSNNIDIFSQKIHVLTISLFFSDILLGVYSRIDYIAKVIFLDGFFAGHRETTLRNKKMFRFYVNTTF